jgi:eukaryotic-like serine/threonine-protein kinase
MTRASDGKSHAPDPAATAAGYQSDNDLLRVSEVRARLNQPLPPPVRIGAYRIMGTLGEGGMGVVYEAVQLSLERTVALKVVRSDLARKEKFVERFLREAKVAARIDHPNVVTIYDTGEADGHLYMALQYVPGGDLASRIKRDGRIDEETSLRIIAGCAKGLIAIHHAGLVHRDIKPSNIFLTTDGTPKIGDLGLARNIIDDEKLTFTGDLVGTPSYMAPEQAKGLPDVDGRADLYSLGTSLYHLLTGRPPFHGSSPFLIGHQVISEVPPDPRELNRSMSPVVAAILHHAMQKDRALRYQNAEEFLVDIELIRSGKMPRFARVTVMDDERRASVTGSLARNTAEDQPTSHMTPVAIVIGMLAGIGLAIAIGLGMARQSQPEVQPLPPAPVLPTVSSQSNQLPVFPPIQDFPVATEPDLPTTDFLAANDPIDRPIVTKSTTPANTPANVPPSSTHTNAHTVTPPPKESALPPPPMPVVTETKVETKTEPKTELKAEGKTAVKADDKKNISTKPAPTIISETETGLRVINEVIVPEPTSSSSTKSTKLVDPPANNSFGPTLIPTPPKIIAPPPVVKKIAVAKPELIEPVVTPIPAPASSLIEQPMEKVVKPEPLPPATTPSLPVVNTKPVWASSTGGDRYGRWAILSIGTTTQRFRLIPAGTVSLGSPDNEKDRHDDETLHRVTLNHAYWLSDTECTQLFWRTIMGENPSSREGDQLPVDNVSHQRVLTFMNTVRQQRADANVRLPSEVEWESACRAGTMGPFTGGIDIRSLAWYRATADDGIAPVARRLPNAYGLFDVHGNVWEWVQDVNRNYPAGAYGQPVASHAFIYRGGSFADNAADCRAARRGGNQTGDGAIGIGFRIAITADMR